MAAGKGTRLRPLTNTTPKSLVKVNGRPFLDFILTNLYEAGITDIAIVVNYFKEQFPEYLQEYQRAATIIEQVLPPGTGNSVMIARNFTGRDDFVVLGGDNLWSPYDIGKLAEDTGLSHVSGMKVEDPSKYGVLVVREDGLLERVVEKPSSFVGDLVNTGLYKFGPRIYDELEKIKVSPRGEFELTDAINGLARSQGVRLVQLRDYWLDLGCLEDIPVVEKHLLQLQT